MYFFTGTVQVVIEGKGVERFLNDCIREDISIWNVRRRQDNAVLFTMRLQDVQALRIVVRRNECSCHFSKRMGLPFWVKRSKRNIGFIGGIFSFFIITFLLSNMVWGIDIEGAEPKTEHLLEKELKKIGIKTGAFQFFLPEPDEIQRKVLEELNEVTWIGVDVNGTTYHIKVVEKKQPEDQEYVQPQHIVATKDAVISKMFVEKGLPMVGIHEHVKKGQILVSGIIGTEENEQLVGAKGEIYGETWYVTTVEIPMKTKFEVLTGEHKSKYKLSMFGFDIPIWGFGKVDFAQFEKERIEKTLKFLHWELPVDYVRETYRQSEEVNRTYTKEQAIEQGISLATANLQEKLDEQEEILEEKVLHQSFENGKVKMKILFQVIEDIVETKPIVQGD